MTETLRWTAALSALVALVSVGLVRRLALRHGVLDHPTDRSSHRVATPRGGGLGLLLGVLAGCAWRAPHSVSWTVVLVVLGGAAVAAVGWIDDRRGLSVRARLLVHVVSAAAVGAAATTDASSGVLVVGLFAWWTICTVSSINLVNFMDGINGLVALQIAVFALSLALFPDPTNAASVVQMAVAGACIGFLPWNFPRARIFLGDVGSGALGFFVPALAILAMRGQGVDVIRAGLPLLPLFGDAIWTILRRWRNGERLTTPHRSHLYQRLANDRLGHAAVTIIYTVMAIAGAVAAHLSGDGWMSPWTLAYAATTILAGTLLHRGVSARTRTAT